MLTEEEDMLRRDVLAVVAEAAPRTAILATAAALAQMLAANAICTGSAAVIDDFVGAVLNDAHALRTAAERGTM